MSTAGPASPTILLVDDDNGFRSSLKGLFEVCGYQVIEALNGQEAIATASRECPDVIVTDINMPVMDGLTASSEIHKAAGCCQDTPILAISGAGLEMRDKALQAGCVDYFNKTESDRLIKVIEQIFRNR
jgi:two-component system, cell cycle response regulator DivK